MQGIIPLLRYELKCGTTLYYFITAESASVKHTLFACVFVLVCLTGDEHAEAL